MEDIQRQDLMDEFVFLAIKYGRLMNDLEFYRRLKNEYNVGSSTAGEKVRNQLLDDTQAQLKELSTRMELIRTRIVLDE